MDKFEDAYLKCKVLALKLLEIESQITKLEIQEVEMRKEIKEALKEIEKATVEKIEEFESFEKWMKSENTTKRAGS